MSPPEPSSIDLLLVQYLDVLSTYTNIQEKVNKEFSLSFQNIARANWAAPRGTRYGEELYDERMKASRHLKWEESEEGTRVKVVDVELAEGELIEVTEEVESKENSEENPKEDSTEDSTGDTSENTPSEDISNTPKEETKEDTPTFKTRQIDSRNPLRWFGLLTPQPLKAAQSHSTQLITELIPNLINTRNRLKTLEIEIGRARKQAEKRRKADEAAVAEGLTQLSI